MRWASTLSRLTDVTAAFGDAASALEQQLDGSAPDLLLAFTSPDHAGGFGQLAAMAARRFPRALLAGCTAGGVIGGAHEAEDGPALSLTAAVLPGAALSGFRVEPRSEPHAGAGASVWRDRVGCPPESRPKFLLLADPFTMDRGLIEELDL